MTMKICNWCALFLGVSSVWGCSPAPPPAPRQGDKLILKINDINLTAEVVFDNLSRKVGLMGRESLPDDHGMLFIFKESRRLGFWMKNTLIPLSIAFINDAGEILQIEDMKPNDLSSTRSKYKVRYALEVNKGWFQRVGIKVGDIVKNFTDREDRVHRYSALAERREESMR